MKLSIIFLLVVVCVGISVQQQNYNRRMFIPAAPFNYYDNRNWLINYYQDSFPIDALMLLVKSNY